MVYLTVTLPKDSQVLVLEDSPMRQAWFKKRIPRLTLVTSVDEMDAYFNTKPICDFIFFDHDLGPNAGTGVDAAQYIKDRFGSNTNAGLIHTWNTVGARNMQALLPRVPYIPFGDFEVEVES